MSEAVVYEQLDPAGPAGAVARSDADLRRLSDVPMEASVEIGRTTMTVGETLQLHVGAVVVLERLAGEPADLLVNGTLIARGEVVVVDEQFGLRVSEIVEDELEGAATLGGSANGTRSAAEPAPGETVADAPPSDQEPSHQTPAEAESAAAQEEGSQATAKGDGTDEGTAEHEQGE